jgi:sporulation protein YlmC with PRC-barrel domain
LRNYKARVEQIVATRLSFTPVPGGWSERTRMTEAMIKGGDIQGMQVTGAEASKLGAVRELFVDLATGRIGFLIVESAGLLGGSGKFHPIPWAAVRFDTVARTFQIQMTKDDFKASPSYDREQLANSSYGWDEQATRYFAG